MSLIQVEPAVSVESLGALKAQYLEQTTAPLDGMWLHGFVPAAAHYVFLQGADSVGFCCVNDEGYLLQFFLRPELTHFARSLFASLVGGEHALSNELRGAFASTAEPQYLASCLDSFARVEVNALMYRRASCSPPSAADVNLRPVVSDELSELVTFAHEAIGAPLDWLRGYYANLIARRQLFGVREGERWLAAGESRVSHEMQEGFADLGVIVAAAQRGRGLATRVLAQLATMNEREGLKSICSTERDNLAAQKAVERAGFAAYHRIVKLER